MANHNLSCMIPIGGLSVNLNPPKNSIIIEKKDEIVDVAKEDNVKKDISTISSRADFLYISHLCKCSSSFTHRVKNTKL